MRPLLALSAVVVGAVVVVAVRGEGPPPEHDGGAARPASLLAVAGAGEARRLLRVDPVSLRPLGAPTARLTAPRAQRTAPLAAPVEGWATAPGGSRLAAVTERGSVVRFFDVSRMRPLGRLPTRARGAVASVSWPRPDRLWLVLARPGCCALGSTTVVVIDPVTRRVVARRLVGGGLARVAATANGPVLLLAPPAVIGPGALATVDAVGRIDEVQLVGMSAGVLPTEGFAAVERVRTPALAVDRAGRRAVVLSSRPHAIEVDLSSGRVRHHRLVPRASLLDRLRELIEPTAEAAAPRVGTVRSAAWVGAAGVAVSGHNDFVVLRSGDVVDAGRRPAGLTIVDTRDWSVSTLDERADGFRAAAGLLLTTGGDGLAAYAPDGSAAFRLFAGRRVEIVATAGSLAYVRTVPAGVLHVVDLAEGRVLATPARDRARLLAELAPRDWR